MKSRTFDHEILLLQGGGALGSYHAGVYEGYAELGREPTWVVGVSIGAITAALIAGNPPDKRVERLRAFWDVVSSYAPYTLPAQFDQMRPFFNLISAGTVATFGSPGFFKPRVSLPGLAGASGPETPAIYDTGPLRETLLQLVDFDLINSREMRISLGVVNVRTGESVYFDNHTTRIGPEHVMASGALPPGFPSVLIDGEHYWDGGIVSNSPLTYVSDARPLTTALIVQVDLFKAIGDLPTTLDQVLERHKDIQYSSKQRFTDERVKEMGEFRDALGRMIDKLPPKLKSDPDVKRLASLCDDRHWTLARLVNQRLPNVSQTKDYEFSRQTVDEHWAAGLGDVRHAAKHQDWLVPSMVGAGVRLFNLTE